MRVAIMLWSKKHGIGKGLFMEVMGAIYGPHYMLINEPEHITGRFNGHLKNLLFIAVDEASFKGDRAASSKIKGMVGAPTVTSETKNLNPITTKMFNMLFFLGQKPDILHVEKDDRRYFVIHCKEEKMPYAEAGALDAGIKSGEIPSTFLYYLQHLELPADYRQDDFPDTAARSEAKIGGLTRDEAFLYNCLYDGHFSSDKTHSNADSVTFGNTTAWPLVKGVIRADALSDAYEQHVEKKDKYIPNWSAFSRILRDKKDGIPLILSTPGWQKMVDGDRFQALLLPGLADARLIFEKACSVASSVWDGGYNPMDEDVEGQEQAVKVAARIAKGAL
jgi:hypothetical protein